MRGRRFGGLLAGGVLLLAFGSGPVAAEGLPTNLSGGEDAIVPTGVASVLPLPGEEPVEVPLPDTPATGGGGEPAPVSNGSGGSGGSGGAGGGTAPSGSGGSGTASSTSGATQGSSGGSKVRGGSGTAAADAADAPAAQVPTTLTGSAGTLATNIGRLAKPLGIPLGLGFVGAVILLIAMQRPVALRKVEEEGPWGYEGRSHRL